MKRADTFKVHDDVRVSDGPFALFYGTVAEVNTQRSRLKVELSVYGRSAPIEVGFGQVEKLS
jgi:transcriptional antiterminator NusG